MRSILIGVMIAFASCAYGHDAPLGWRYEPYCCNGNDDNGDCQMIPTKSVKIVQGGYQVTLAPGDHRLVTRYHVFKLPQQTTRRSQDSAYHLCLFPDENTPRCFYAPDMGY